VLGVVGAFWGLRILFQHVYEREFGINRQFVSAGEVRHCRAPAETIQNLDRGRTMTCFRFSGIATTFCFWLFFLHIPFSYGQPVPATPTAGSASASELVETIAPLEIKLSVEEIRLDVVVLDRNGNPVTDLTAADFEVFQNGARQNVLSSVYIDNQPDVAAKPSTSRKDVRNFPSVPAVDLKREDTRRTIIFVLDDISMSFENGYYAKMALRNFVEKQMQIGDMVAILRTGYGNSALNMFLSDKNQLLARIDAMRLERANQPLPEDFHLHRIYGNQLSTLSYSLRALKDMPGRKILIMMSAYPTLRTNPNDSRRCFYTLYNERFFRLADDAMRAGVIVNFLNIDGLYRQIRENVGAAAAFYAGGTSIIGADASINLEHIREEARYLALHGTRESVRLLQNMYPWLQEEAKKQHPMNALNPLPIRTGGVLLENSNFFLEGIGRETESLMRGYYLISYAPPPGTFSTDDKEIYNQIRVNVRRRNVQVHTRAGFFNRLESGTPDGPPAHPLQTAIFSPFLHADLDVNIAAGYIRDAKAGYHIRSWIHLDPKDVKIVETEDGGARIEFEAVCLTSDINGFVQDFVHAKYTFNIAPENKAENLAWIQRHGIRFAMLLPVKIPGSYYVRVAVEDVESGKVGSAYQFVEIPDVGRRGLELSNIFIITSNEDLNWLRSEVTAESGAGLFFPAFQTEEVRSPALRTYTIGDSLIILAMLYNAEENAVADSEIEMQFVLYKDGSEFLRSSKPINQVGRSVTGNLDGIPLLLELTMGTDIPPGDYVLQFDVTDKRNSRRPEGSASQAISFAVVK
jgi:VWFA-related protein